MQEIPLHINNIAANYLQNEPYGAMIKFLWLYTKDSMAQVLSNPIFLVIKYMVNNHILYMVPNKIL
jgi:hypothetical protein